MIVIFVHPGRIWNVEPETLLSSNQLAVFFDYVENLYAVYLENDKVKAVKIDVTEGIKVSNLSLFGIYLVADNILVHNYSMTFSMF